MQIELVFKPFKQNLHIQTIRGRSEAYTKTILCAWLLIWILVEKQAILEEQYLDKKRKMSHKLMKFMPLTFYANQGAPLYVLEFIY